jgi:Papain-like cysteine protease AvrRpt2
VPQLKQVGNTCWAVSATMMLSWKRQQSMTPDAAMTEAGKKWIDLYVACHDNKADGLPAADHQAFIAALQPPMSLEPPASYTIGAYVSFLTRYGLLWVETEPGPNVASAHVRIMRGIQGNGTPDGTYVDLIDPATGSEYTATFAQFEKEMEDLGALDNAAHADRVQIAHF